MKIQKKGCSQSEKIGRGNGEEDHESNDEGSERDPGGYEHDSSFLKPIKHRSEPHRTCGKHEHVSPAKKPGREYASSFQVDPEYQGKPEKICGQIRHTRIDEDVNERGGSII